MRRCEGDSSHCELREVCSFLSYVVAACQSRDLTLENGALFQQTLVSVENGNIVILAN